VSKTRFAGINQKLLALCLLALLSFPMTAQQSGVDKQAIEEANKNVAEAQQAYKVQLAPLEANLGNQKRFLSDAQTFKQDADAALKSYEDGKAWYEKLRDDDKTTRLKLQKDAADKLVSDHANKIRSLEQSIKTTEQARDSFIAFEEQKILKADPAKVAAEATERAAEVETLNGEYYTRVAQQNAAEISFENKLSTLDTLIAESEKAGLGDVADAIRKDREIIADVQAQWVKGQDTAIAVARRDLDNAYQSNSKDGIGPTQWANSKTANDASFIDRSAVEASVRTSNTLANSALANTQQDMSLQAFLEDYGNSALIDPKTGNWDPKGVATRYGYYAKGAGLAAKDSVVDLAVMAVDLGETAAQATEEAIGQSNYLGRDKIDKAYAAGNAVADLSDADSAEAKVRREQLSRTVTGVLDKSSRDLEQTAAQGEKGVNKAMQGTGYVVGTVLDPVFNAKGVTKAGQLDAAADLNKLDTAADATRAERAANKVDDARGTDPLNRIDADEMAGRGQYLGTSADDFAKTMREAGLEPQRTVTVGDKTFHMSQPFESDGRTWVIALEETADGKVIPRQMYLSGEHGVWRAAPGFDGSAIAKGPRGPDGKFANEGITDVDAALQGTLDELRTDFGVKKVDAFDGQQLTTKALEDASDAGKVPAALETDLTRATRPLPRDANGNLPAGMRPDFTEGIVSVTRIDDHPQYGAIDRIVVTSKDGSTNWIINRAENGDTWVGGAQDASAGLTSLGTRNQGWDLGDLTAQPKTKSPDGSGYVDAEGWKNPVNELMAWELDRADLSGRKGPPAPPQGPKVVVRAGENGVPVLIDENGVRLELGEKLGEGSGAAVYAVKGRPDLVIKIGKPGANTRLDDFGAAAIREVDPTGSLIQIPETYGRQQIDNGLIPDALDGEPLNGGAVSIVDRAPQSFDKARKTADGLADMSTGQKSAYRDGMEALNAKGYALADNHPGNYAFKKVPGSEDDWILVIVDAETLIPFKSPDAARRFQQALDDPSRYAIPDIPMNDANWQRGDLDFGRAVHQEGLANEFNGEVDWTRWNRETGSKYTSLGGTAAATDPSVVKFNPMNGIKNPGIATPADYVPTRKPVDSPDPLVAQTSDAPGADRVDPKREATRSERDQQLDDYEAGLDKRRSRLEGEANPSNLPTRRSIAQLGARSTQAAADEAQRGPDDEEEEEKDPFILIGEALFFEVVPEVSFAFGRTVWSDEEDWVDPGEKTYISLGDDASFELESAISLDGTNVHSQLALTGQTVTQTGDPGRSPPKPPPVRQDPPPPPAQKPPELVIGQPVEPIKQEPVKEEKPEPPKEEIVEKKPPPSPPPEKKEPKKIGIGTGTGGATHRTTYSFACFRIQLVGDIAYADEATFDVSGPGGSEVYDFSISGSAIRLEHKIYSYGKYDYELESATDKEGKAMTITGNPRGSYEVTAEEKPCW
jgi:hypothetical protein